VAPRVAKRENSLNSSEEHHERPVRGAAILDRPGNRRDFRPAFTDSGTVVIPHLLGMVPDSLAI
jgi:hypothetical protein